MCFNNNNNNSVVIIITWDRVFLEKHTNSQLVNKFPTFCGT